MGPLSGPQLRMSVRRSGSTAVLQLRGEADIAVEARLRLRLGDLLAEGAAPVQRLVVDATELDFLDLSGLQALLDAAARLRGRGGELVLRRPGRRVLRLLTVVGVGDALQIED